MLAALLGECWHETTESTPCSKCGEWLFIHTNYVIGNRLSYETIDKIVEQMPEVWEDYLKARRLNNDLIGSGMDRPFRETQGLNFLLQAANFIQHLYDHQGWAWVKCPDGSECRTEIRSMFSCLYGHKEKFCHSSHIPNPKYAEARELLIKGMEGE